MTHASAETAASETVGNVAENGDPPERFRFRLRTLLVAMIPWSWYLAIVSLGGFVHVTVALILGAIAGGYAASAGGLLVRRPTARRTNRYPFYGAVAGAVLLATLAAFVRDAIVLLLPAMAAAVTYLIAAIARLVRDPTGLVATNWPEAGHE